MHLFIQKIKSFFKRELPELMLVDKPKGITSYDVIRRLQKKYGRHHKMGHAGTLDPNATGLLIVGLGKGTKRLHELVGLDKTYQAEILLGIKTDTGDIVGKIIEEKLIPKELSDHELNTVLCGMLGTHEVTVPVYSAIKIAGKPLYKYARQGTQVDVPKKNMTIHTAEITSIDLPVLRIDFRVSSGTYIRALAEIVGERLGTVATLQNLRRTKIGEFDIKKARKI